MPLDDHSAIGRPNMTIALPRALALALFAISQSPSQQAVNPSSPSASLEETLQWVKSYLDDDRIDLTGIRIIKSFAYQGCDVTLQETAGRATLVRADFNLKSLSYLRLRTEPRGSNTIGTSLVFQTDGARSIREIDPAQAQVAGLTPTTQLESQLPWQIGYVKIGADNPYTQLGQRLINALSHAVELCGGKIRKEPF